MQKLEDLLVRYTETRNEKDKNDFFDRFIKLYLKKILSLIRKYEKVYAEDIASNVLVKLSKTDPNNLLNAFKQFDSYIFRATRNCIYDFYNRNRKNASTLSLHENIDSNKYHEDEVAQMDSVAHIYMVLSQLPGNQGRALRLHIEGFKHKEIASILNTAPDGVADLIWRARQKLKDSYNLDELI